MKTWFTITAAADTNKPTEVYIYGDIGAWGVTAQAFADAWKAIPAEKEILLRISSSGGSVFDGLAIHTLVAARRSKVTAQVDSIAASMASIIMCAAGKITASENAWIMIHNAAAGGWGDGDDLRKVAELLDKIRDQMAGIYEARTGKSRDDIVKAMDDETWFTAKEAMDFGLIDEVTEAIEAAASVDPSRFKHAPKALSGGQPASTNQPNAKMKNLIKALVDAKLIASTDVSEDTAVAQFGANFATQANANADLTAANTDLQTKLDAANAKIAASLKAAAEAAVDSAVKAGRIKEEATLRAKWVDAYVRDEAGTKAMLDSLPEAKQQRGVPPVATTPPAGTVPPAKELTGLARTIAAMKAKAEKNQA